MRNMQKKRKHWKYLKCLREKTSLRSASKQIIIATFVFSLVCFFFYGKYQLSFQLCFLFVYQVRLVVNWVHLLYLKSCSFRLKCLCVLKKSRNPKKKTLLLRNILIKCKLRRKKTGGENLEQNVALDQFFLTVSCWLSVKYLDKMHFMAAHQLNNASNGSFL